MYLRGFCARIFWKIPPQSRRKTSCRFRRLHLRYHEGGAINAQNISAEKETEKQGSRLPQENGYRGRQKGPQETPRQGPCSSDALIRAARRVFCHSIPSRASDDVRNVRKRADKQKITDAGRVLSSGSREAPAGVWGCRKHAGKPRRACGAAANSCRRIQVGFGFVRIGGLVRYTKQICNIKRNVASTPSKNAQTKNPNPYPFIKVFAKARTNKFVLKKPRLSPEI